MICRRGTRQTYLFAEESAEKARRRSRRWEAGQKGGMIPCVIIGIRKISKISRTEDHYDTIP